MAYGSWLIRIAKRLDNRNLDNEEDGCFSTETVCAPKNNETMNDEEDVDVDSGALSLVRILGYYYCDAAMLVTLSIPDVPAATCCISCASCPKSGRTREATTCAFIVLCGLLFWKENTALLDALV